jgi:hypothetical protein
LVNESVSSSLRTKTCAGHLPSGRGKKNRSNRPLRSHLIVAAHQPHAATLGENNMDKRVRSRNHASPATVYAVELTEQDSTRATSFAANLSLSETLTLRLCRTARSSMSAADTEPAPQVSAAITANAHIRCLTYSRICLDMRPTMLRQYRLSSSRRKRRSHHILA